MSALSFRQLVGLEPSKASTKDSALLIIDAQNEYAQGKLKVTNAESSRKVIAKLLERYRSGNGKIVHITHQTPKGAPLFTPDTELAKEFAELKPKDGEEHVVKQFPGSFYQTKLKEILDKWGVKKIVLVGYMAHVCVSTTARQGHELGYDVLIVEDGVGDRDVPGAKGEDVTKMVMIELADCFGTVIQSSDIQ